MEEQPLATLLESEGGAPDVEETRAFASEREDQSMGSSRLLINEVDTLVGDAGTSCSYKSLVLFRSLSSNKEVGVVGAASHTSRVRVPGLTSHSH